MQAHSDYMQRALRLARKGTGRVSPNPLVGAVLVGANGAILAEGFHARHGAIHAEIDALQNYERTHRLQVPENSTLYCTLEPCSHQGKGKINPPCAPQIIAAGIRNVVIAMVDPNPRVQGNGVKMLQQAGVDVTTGICEAEAQALNRKFTTHILYKRPHILLKMAQTLDGQIATVTGDSQWVTNKAARAKAHILRAEYDAVMVGSGTAVYDNPRLTVRHVKGRNPYRILIDSGLQTPADYHLFQDNMASKTWVYTTCENAGSKQISAAYQKKGAQLIGVEQQGTKLCLSAIFQDLYSRGIYSVMVEGGSALITALLQQHLADSVHIAIAPKILGRGKPAIGDLHHVTMSEARLLKDVTYEHIEQQIICEGHFRSCLPDSLKK